MRNKKRKSDFTQHVLEFGLHLIRVTIKIKFLSILKRKIPQYIIKNYVYLYNKWHKKLTNKIFK